MKEVRVKLWGVLFAILMCTTFIPVMNRVTVLLTYGWSGYSAGIRVAWVKPPQFTNGQDVPSEKAMLAMGITLFGMLAIFLAPVLGLPRGLRGGGGSTEKRPDN